MTSRHVAFWLAAASLLATLAMLLLPAPGAGASILVTDAIQDGPAPAPRHACLVHEAFVQGNRIVAENPAAFAEIPCPPAAKTKAGGRRRRV